jgi:hypothetical protein
MGNRHAGGVPTCDDVARSGDVTIKSFIEVGAGYIKLQACRPAEIRKKKEERQQ